MDYESFYKFSPFILPLVLVIAVQWYKNRWGKSDLVDAFVYDDVVVTAASVSYKARHGWYRRSRLKSFNAETGRRNKRKMLNGEYEIAMVVNGLIWAEAKQRNFTKAHWHMLRAFNMQTLGQVYDLSKIKKQFGVSTRARLSEFGIVKESAKIKMTTEDGFKHVFDCNTLSVPGASTKIKRPGNPGGITDKYSGKFNFIKMENAKRYELWYEEHLICKGQSFIEPVCLHASENPTGNNNLVFAHAEGLNDASSVFITVVDATGQIVEGPVRVKSDNYTVEICGAGATETQHVFVTKNAQRGIVFAVSKANGIISWRKTI